MQRQALVLLASQKQNRFMFHNVNSFRNHRSNRPWTTKGILLTFGLAIFLTALVVFAGGGCSRSRPLIKAKESEYEQIYPAPGLTNYPAFNAEITMGSRGATGANNNPTPPVFETDREVQLENLSHKFLRNGQAPVTDMVFIQDGDRIAYTLGDGSIRIWDWKKKTSSWILSKTPRKFNQLAYSNTSRQLVACTVDGLVRVWKSDQWQTEEIFATGHEKVLAMEFSSTGALFVTGGPEKAVLWDTQTWNPIHTIRAPGYSFFKDFVFSPDGQYMVSAGGDGALRFWSMTDFQPWNPVTQKSINAVGKKDPNDLLEIASPWTTTITQHLNQIAFSSDGQWILGVGGQKKIFIYNIAEKAVTYVIDDLKAVPRGLAFGAGGPWFATALKKEMLVWFYPSRQELPRRFQIGGQIRALEFSPEGDWLAAADENGSIAIWNLGGPEFFLQDKHIRWKMGEPEAPPMPKAIVNWETESAKAGTSVELSIDVSNLGKGDLFRLLAMIQMPWTDIDQGPIYFGNIHPMENIPRTVSIPIPLGLKSGKYPITISFEELYGLRPPNQTLELEVLPADLPILEIVVEWSEDGSGLSTGNGNGILETMEGADVRVVVKNTGTVLAKSVTVQMEVDLSVKKQMRLFQTEPVSLDDILPGKQVAESFALMSDGAQAAEIPVHIVVKESAWGVTSRALLRIPTQNKIQPDPAPSPDAEGPK